MQVASDASLRAFNTLSLEARATAMTRVADADGLRTALAWAAERELPAIPLGEGSNVVFAGDVDALVIRQESRGIDLLDEQADNVILRVAAGENWHGFVRWCLEQGYHGLENLALIPGTVGAAPVQNVGAYGVELAAFVDRVHAVSVNDGAEVQLSAEECEFAYRHSVFKGRLRDHVVITAVDLRLSRQPVTETFYPSLAAYLQEAGIVSPWPREIFDAVVAIRSSRLPDPAREPNAGSFFKNPQLDASAASDLQARFPGLPAYPQADSSVKLPAAWMIEHCGFKGARRGGVGVHHEHALVLVNHGDGTGEELLQLASDIEKAVRETFGIGLVIEPRVYGRPV